MRGSLAGYSDGVRGSSDPRTQQGDMIEGVTMRVEFTLRIRGLDPEGCKIDAIEKAGFDDSLMGVDRHGDGGTLEIEREGDPITIIRDAINAAESAGVEVVGIKTPALVTCAEIAERVGRTRASITQLSTGVRGRGGFPDPINPGARHQIWVWPEVADWFGVEYDEADRVIVSEALRIAAERHAVSA